MQPLQISQGNCESPLLPMFFHQSSLVQNPYLARGLKNNVNVKERCEMDKKGIPWSFTEDEGRFACFCRHSVSNLEISKCSSLSAL